MDEPDGRATAEAPSRVAELSLLGGSLCLDFIDTVDWRLREPPDECLTNYTDLVAWARRADAVYGGVLDPREAEALRRAAAAHPERARATLGAATALREALYRLFRAIARGESPPPDDLGALNAALAGAAPRARIARAGAGYAWGWRGGEDDLDRMLWPVARSAADLLTSRRLARVRACAGEGCGWLFLDTSKNRSRRWCAMEGCGNRAKARRHYRRAKAARAAED